MVGRTENTRQEEGEGECVQLALDQQGAGADHSWRAGIGIFNDENEVSAILSRDPAIAVLKLLLADFAHRSQHPKAVEEPSLVVGSAQCPQLVAVRQSSLNLGGEEVIGEKSLFSHCAS